MKKTRIIAIVNQKGGVGKTATAMNLGAALAKSGAKVLLVDLDPQANLSLCAGVNILELQDTVYDLIVEKKKAADVIIKDVYPGVDIIPSHLDLSSAEFELSYKVGREQVMKDSLSGVLGNYDYLLIDCPPYLGVLTINALTMATEVLIPVQVEFLSLIGLKKLEETVEVVRNRLNPKLSLSFVVPTLYDKRNRMAGEVMGLLKKNYGKSVTKTIVRRNVQIAESSALGKPIMDYRAKSTGAADYTKLAAEVRKKGK